MTFPFAFRRLSCYKSCREIERLQSIGAWMKRDLSLTTRVIRARTVPDAGGGKSDYQKGTRFCLRDMPLLHRKALLAGLTLRQSHSPRGEVLSVLSGLFGGPLKEGAVAARPRRPFF